jgi:hypothetical protein
VQSAWATIILMRWLNMNARTLMPAGDVNSVMAENASTSTVIDSGLVRRDQSLPEGLFCLVMQSRSAPSSAVLVSPYLRPCTTPNINSAAMPHWGKRGERRDLMKAS